MDEKQATTHEAEREVLGGATHCEVGAWAAEQWNLPLGIIESIQLHHAPQQIPKNSHLPKLIHLADVVCYRVGMPAATPTAGKMPQGPPQVYPFLQENEALCRRFRERYEEKRKEIEAPTQ